MTAPLPPRPALAPSERRAVEAIQRILDTFAVAEKLREIRDYVWRGGEVSFQASHHPRRPGQPAGAYYELRAVWDTAAFERLDGEPSTALVPTAGGVVEGAWKRVRTGYWLRIGIDVLGAPSALYLHARELRYVVPYARRPYEQVERALAGGLAEYTSAFLAGRQPVPQAVAAAEKRLRQYGL